MKPVKTTTALGYMGVKISLEMARCVRLYAHSRNISISQVLRSIIRSWIDSICLTEDILINEIVERAVQEWDKKTFLDSFADIDTFRGNWRADLCKKLSDDTCDLIVEEFNRRYMT